MTYHNPKGNVSVINLRSDKELASQHPTTSNVATFDSETDADLIIQQQSLAKIIILPFPCRTFQARKLEMDDELLETFRKVEINIHLLNAIKRISKYVKFLKELCTPKRKLKGDVKMRRNPTMPIVEILELLLFYEPFTILCTLGKCTSVDAMLDLGTLLCPNFVRSV
ncbi:hypothetical protein CR513_32541, partial [Mucuna pruriens]